MVQHNRSTVPATGPTYPERNTISYTCACSDCAASGLYQGMCERDGAAVVCRTCRGTGRREIHVSYLPFLGRRSADGVVRVYQVNPGIVVDGLGTVPGGCSREEWEQDQSAPARVGAEMRGHTCPAWWYQSADYKRKPAWPECIGSRSFCDCPHFPAKAGCWERWDREQP